MGAVRIMRLWATTMAAGLSALLLPAGALGQATPPAAAGGGATGLTLNANCNQPVDVTADALEVYRDQRLTVFKGNVEAIQCDTRIRTPQLSLFSAAKPGGPPAGGGGISPGASFGEVERMEATGPVYYISASQQARGDKAIYERAPDTITLIGNVIVTQDKNVVAGDKLVIEQKTGHSTMISNSPQPRRVRGVFYPQQQAQPAGQPAPPTAAPAAKPAKPAAPARRAKPRT